MLKNRFWRVARLFVAAGLLTASESAAQDSRTVTLTPENPLRWDVAAHVGWFGGNKAEIGPQWNRWYDAASFGASAGYYWTSHVKLELEGWTTTQGEFFTQEFVNVPGVPSPLFLSREHFFRATTVAGGLSYQFLENTWFHPFASAGVEAGRETVRIATLQPPPFTRDGIVVPDPLTERAASSWVRPYVAAGFKWYVSERAFVRGDLRASPSTARVETVVWRGGIGVDF